MYVKAVLLKMCSAKSGFSDKTLLGNVYYFLSWKLSMYIKHIKGPKRFYSSKTGFYVIESSISHLTLH